MDSIRPPSGSGGAATDRAARREVAQLVNPQKRKIAEDEVLALRVADERYAFMCECGCMKWVELPLAVYDADGAWIAGHEPEAAGRD